MTNHDRFLAYLRHYADKNIDQVAAMFSEGITLRDWNSFVSGKDSAVSETRKNFESAKSLEIQVLALYEGNSSMVGELRIQVDGSTELYVVDVVEFDGDGKIASIRAYLGRANEQ